jgi:hypothetical protein
MVAKRALTRHEQLTAAMEDVARARLENPEHP